MLFPLTPGDPLAKAAPRRPPLAMMSRFSWFDEDETQATLLSFGKMTATAGIRFKMVDHTPLDEGLPSVLLFRSRPMRHAPLVHRVDDRFETGP